MLLSAIWCVCYFDAGKRKRNYDSYHELLIFVITILAVNVIMIIFINVLVIIIVTIVMI